MMVDYSDIFDSKSVKDAVKQIKDLSRLGQHPLAKLQIVEKRLREKGRSESSDGYGYTLQEILVDLINESLDQLENVTNPSDLEQGFLIIRDQYLDEKSVSVLIDTYPLTESTIHRRKHSAYQEIGKMLRMRDEELIDMGDEEKHYLCLAPTKPKYSLSGRNELLHELKNIITVNPNGKSVTLLGNPGIGKTALAIELAHDPSVQDYFKDGVLWAGLGREPDIMKHLGNWALALGFSRDEIAAHKNISDRQNVLKAALSIRKMLLVIDDAWKSQSATVLQLGGLGCAHLFTTRVTTEAMDFSSENNFTIQKLRNNDSLEILTTLAPKSVESDLDITNELVHAVDGLPLAIVLLGRYLQKIERFSNQPKYLREVLTKFREAEVRLSLTQPQTPPGHHPSLPDDVPISLLAIIAISEEELSNTDRNAFYSLALFPPEPNTFSVKAAVAITHSNMDTIANLVNSALLNTSGVDRLKMHSVINDYANMRLVDKTVQVRFLNYFEKLVYEKTYQHGSLSEETKNILASIELAIQLREWNYFLYCVTNYANYSFAIGSYDLVEPYLHQCVEIAKKLKNRRILIASKMYLGRISAVRGETEKASTLLLDCAALARMKPQDTNLVSILVYLGNLEITQGNYDKATHYIEEALQFTKDNNCDMDIAALISSLGTISGYRGDLVKAEEYFIESYKLSHDNKDWEGESSSLQNLASVASQLGKYKEAEKYLEMGLSIARSIGSKVSLSRLLCNLADLKNVLGEHNLAQKIAVEAYQIAKEMGYRDQMSWALFSMGSITKKIGDFSLAKEQFNICLDIAREVGNRRRVGNIMPHLAEIDMHFKHFAEAEVKLIEGLEIAIELGNRDAECEILSQLGIVYNEQRKLDAASKVLNDALRIAKEIGNHEFTAAVIYQLSIKEELLGNVPKAIRLTKESIEIMKGLGHKLKADVTERLDNLLKEQQRK
ncbi:MAG: tetratricopeptide repeat protein [Candidatus Brocadiales bacterium]|nr:tetratricopeptide repeat protein [Candidatus Brocadiales bacterium]